MAQAQKSKSDLLAFAKTRGYSYDDVVDILKKGGVEGKFDALLYDKYSDLIEICHFARTLPDTAYMPDETFVVLRAANMLNASLEHQKALLKARSVATKWKRNEELSKPTLPLCCPICGSSVIYDKKWDRRYTAYRWGWRCEDNEGKAFNYHFILSVWRPALNRVRAITEKYYE